MNTSLNNIKHDDFYGMFAFIANGVNYQTDGRGDGLYKEVKIYGFDKVKNYKEFSVRGMTETEAIAYLMDWLKNNQLP